MPTNRYPFNLLLKNKKDSKEEATLEKDQQTIDYGLKMINAIDIEFIDTNLYMSKELKQNFNNKGVFGGQIVAQALHAGWNTIADDFFVHSLHAYFILACNADHPVIYKVQRVRDGRSFTTRIVTATQKGRAIFICSTSFAKVEEGVTLSHRTDMPDVADPETLPDEQQLVEKALRTRQTTDTFPANFMRRVRMRLSPEEDHPIDFRDLTKVTSEEVISGNAAPNPHSRRWIKTRGALNDDLKIHALAIAYASDSWFINTAAKANGFSANSESIGMMVSLDHTMWFHMPARADEWLLYDMFSPRTIGGRGMVLGRIYSRDGTLIATTAQEGVVRLSETEIKRREQQDEEKGLSSSKL